jgi:lipopolysaccharide export LptBFGC system permease protein LptF
LGDLPAFRRGISIPGFNGLFLFVHRHCPPELYRMSKTLFWYLLKDLLRIFAMTSGTLAGIMSFGALLRPLTQYGLGLGQVGQILSYFSPAMTTYSLPIAALFATTIVYGRLSADNELTACRASGISSIMMTAPAFLLGLIVALISLAFLSFIVPVFTLKVEKVIYSNIAQLVANKITRTHEISYGRTSIFAQSAEVQTPDEVILTSQDPQVVGQMEEYLRNAGFHPKRSGLFLRTPCAEKAWQPILLGLRDSLAEKDRPGVRGIVNYLSPGGSRSSPEMKSEAMLAMKTLIEVVDDQVVDLYSPIIFTYETVPAPEPDDPADVVPADKNDKSRNSMKVPSKIWIAKRATAYISQQGDTVKLRAVLTDGSNFPRGVGGTQAAVGQSQFGPIDMGTPIRENTKFMDVAELKRLLRNPESSRRLKAIVQQFIRDEQREVYFRQIEASLKDPALKSFRFDAETESLVASGEDLDTRTRGTELVINPRSDPDTAHMFVDRYSNGAPVSHDTAKQIRITIDPEDAPEDSDAPRRMVVSIRCYDVIVEADEDPAAHETFLRTINMPMPADLQAVQRNDVGHYLKLPSASRREQDDLKYNYNKLLASIRSEMHSRASFAVSCFILVMVGCALGMISKSGNFLSAFAVSVVPALLCIALIVTGQHVCESTPKSMGMGLSLIWSGNVMVLILAVFLLGKLQRQ